MLIAVALTLAGPLVGVTATERFGTGMVGSVALFLVASLAGAVIPLDAVDEATLSEKRFEAYLDEMYVSWTNLPRGRAFNGADVTDVESTDVLREALVESERTVHGPEDAGDDWSVDDDPFERNTEVPTTGHALDAGRVLDSALATGRPVVPMGKAVADFICALDAETVSRSED